MLESTPVTRLSRARTSQPSASSRSQRCDPRNPAPPVTTARMHPPGKRRLASLAPGTMIDLTCRAGYHAPAQHESRLEEFAGPKPRRIHLLLAIPGPGAVLGVAI